MPLGSTHIETGLLSTEGRWYILARDDGGRWRLDISPGKAKPWLGKRVLINGTRGDFDILDVHTIEAAPLR